MTEQWQITVHKRCSRSGICAATAPRYFFVDSDHRTKPVARMVSPDLELLEAAGGCPSEAITVHDSVTGAPITGGFARTPDPKGDQRG